MSGSVTPAPRTRTSRASSRCSAYGAPVGRVWPPWWRTANSTARATASASGAGSRRRNSGSVRCQVCQFVKISIRFSVRRLAACGVVNGWHRFFFYSGSVRLRLPAVRVREDSTSSADEPEADGPGGSGTMTGEADAAEPGAGSVRDDIEQQPGPPLAVPPAVTNALLAFQRSYRRAAEEGERLAERWWWLPGRAFAVITIAPALLAIALLVPGTGMLLAGRLLPVPVLIIFVPLAVALCYFGMRGLPVQWPLIGKPAAAVATAGSDAGADADGGRVGVPVGALLATVAIAAGFGVWQAALRSEQLFTVGDPSVYLQYGYWIAEHGTARIPTLASSYGTSGGLVFASSGFSVSGGS